LNKIPVEKNGQVSVDDDGNGSKQLKNEPLARKPRRAQENIFADSGNKSSSLKPKDAKRETESMLDGKYSKSGEMVDYPEGGYRADPIGATLDDGLRSSDLRNEDVMGRPNDYIGRMMNNDPY
jgi:hypothetical protein